MLCFHQRHPVRNRFNEQRRYHRYNVACNRLLEIFDHRIQRFSYTIGITFPSVWMSRCDFWSLVIFCSSITLRIPFVLRMLKIDETNYFLRCIPYYIARLDILLGLISQWRIPMEWSFCTARTKDNANTKKSISLTASL